MLRHRERRRQRFSQRHADPEVDRQVSEAAKPVGGSTQSRSGLTRPLYRTGKQSGAAVYWRSPQPGASEIHAAGSEGTRQTWRHGRGWRHGCGSSACTSSPLSPSFGREQVHSGLSDEYQ